MNASAPHPRVWVTRGIAALGTAALVSGLAACSAEDASPKNDAGLVPLTLQLQWVAQAQFSGYYAALDQGYFADEGLDVTLLEGGPDIVPQDVLAAGDVDYAVAWVPKVLGSIEQGAEITNIAQIFERSATLQISFVDQDITSVADFAGKRVGSWGYGNEWEVFAGMQQAGVELEDITLIQQAFDMNGFLSGDIDAAQAMTYNEYAQVLETINPDTGELIQPEELNVIDWNEEGTGMLQDAIWSSSERLENDSEFGEVTVRFLKAVVRGWAFARDNPEEAAAIVAAAGSTLGESHQLWMANEVNRVIWPSTNGVGYIDPGDWERTVTIALDTRNESNATVISSPPPENAHTNEFISQALEALEEDGLDTKNPGFTPITVELREGGN